MTGKINENHTNKPLALETLLREIDRQSEVLKEEHKTKLEISGMNEPMINNTS